MMISDVRLWTVEEYHTMIRAGILTPDDQVELLDGEIINMSPQYPPHAATTQRTFNYLFKKLMDRAFLRMQLPITLSRLSEPEPDIAVVRIVPDEYSDRHPIIKDIFLIIEVADATLNRDCGKKARIYANAKIPEYWVLDVNEKQIYVFRRPENGIYIQETTYQKNQQITPLSFPDINIDIQQIFI
jgi:Uma2 family endonuclease